ncbi:MAG TPA: M20/M25/M40 family metallo-hydrolase [Clostridia bacterium]|nr:M20/M25/M40 family metallo-hydrolase [Clostridia bacterium]
MKRLSLIFLCLILFTACGLEKSTRIIEKENSFRPQIKEHLEILSSEKFAGREAETGGEAIAAFYIAQFLQEQGLTPCGDAATYFQTFTINGYRPFRQNGRMIFKSDPSLSSQKSANVLGLREGESKDIIIISAHYDHLGIIDGQLYPGANDNASGVSVVLEIINGLGKRKTAYTMLFAFWGAEEKGLLGSQYFCEHLPFERERIKGVINLDSVGNLKKQQLLGWLGEENEITNKIIAGLENEGWTITWEKNRKHNSDHFSFAQKGIPGFTLLSPTWLVKNHTSADEIQQIKIKPLENLVLALLNILP